MVSIISVVVLTIVVISFGSIVIALRCICSIAFTVIFVSGLAKLVYCNDAFGSAFYGFTGNGSLVWLVPPTIFPLLVGLALDYDIFLVRGSSVHTRTKLLCDMYGYHFLSLAGWSNRRIAGVGVQHTRFYY